jgi:nitroimidazol reductase NimA-like FMN-containing flavoprotein (pyridoxamine 5'-phosphate oxidase superfamily)
LRRKDREVTEKSVIDKIINEAEFCRIALSNGNEPYIIPMNFGYKDNCVYLHSAKEGKKLDILKINNNVCFQVESQVELVKSENPCEWSTRYYCVIGFGIASIIDDIDEKRRALDIIMEKYTKKPVHEYSENALNKMLAIKVELNSITCKKAGYN